MAASDYLVFFSVLLLSSSTLQASPSPTQSPPSPPSPSPSPPPPPPSPSPPPPPSPSPPPPPSPSPPPPPPSPSPPPPPPSPSPPPPPSPSPPPPPATKSPPPSVPPMASRSPPPAPPQHLPSASPPMDSRSSRQPPPHSPSQSPRHPPPPPLPEQPPPRPSSPPPTPASTQPPQQLSNIIDALIGAGDFGNWVNIISGANPLILPLSATLFIPQDDAVNRLLTADPFMFPYHVIPQRLSFSDLQLFKPNARLPTLLPGKSIVITSNNRSNFSVDGSPITQPDLYITATIAVHGVGAILDYTVYGDGLDLLPKPTSEGQPQLIRPPPGPLLPDGDNDGENNEWRSSMASQCLGIQFPVALSIACAVLALGR
ncbi:uncharacterized protein LOC107416555 [Ziziphus jujuba]|uniref:Uncharacterized protein LOC107416555 n=1 Tax=Ziziphus jujuba TaxID=326968 RepID=A0A6P3ZY27_ZIZJJ|nr:uncharacterized protein LOC107416555 [Ziziphus jujuba]